jgi:hypothetical protein
MARAEFLSNFRTARNLFLHSRDEGNGSPIAVWLTPRSVQGFDAADFPELGPDRQRDLQLAVDEFLQVAKQVPPTELPTRQQWETARGAFEKMLALLGPRVPISEEGYRVEAAIKGVEFPPWVASWDFRLDTDWTDEPAVWVTLYVDKYLSLGMEAMRESSELSRKILWALSDAGINRWPYLPVHSVADHRAV